MSHKFQQDNIYFTRHLYVDRNVMYQAKIDFVVCK